MQGAQRRYQRGCSSGAPQQRHRDSGSGGVGDLTGSSGGGVGVAAATAVAARGGGNRAKVWEDATRVPQSQASGVGQS
jgi:hypothetical protein